MKNLWTVTGQKGWDVVPSYEAQNDRIQLEPACFSSSEVIIEGHMLSGFYDLEGPEDRWVL